MSLEDMVAAPSEIKFGEKRYRIAPLRFFERGILQEYINENARSPLKRTATELAGLDLPADIRTRLLAEALEQTKHWQPPILGDVGGSPIICPDCGKLVDFKRQSPSGGDDDWNAVLMERPEGVRFFLRTVLSIHHPEITDAEIDEICKNVDFKGQNLRPLTLKAFDMRDDDPKASQGQDGPPTLIGSSSTSSNSMTSSPTT